MTFVIFCLQELGAFGFMVFVSHLSHSNASVRQALPHLVYDLTVCSPITCFDTELIGPSSMSPAFFSSHTFSTVSLFNGILDPSMSLSSFYSLFHPSWLPDCFFPPLPLATACWIKHCWSLSQRICRLQKIRLPSLYPITDGSSKQIKTLVGQMLHLVSVTPQTDASTLNTCGSSMCFCHC